MAAATTPQAQPPQQSRQQEPSDSHLLGLAVTALGAYWSAKALSRALRLPFRAAGISGDALSAVAALVSSWPHEAMEGTGPAQRWAIRQNLLRRASFFLHAARRTQAAIVAARSKDEPVMGAIRDALAAEQRFMALHVQASTGRVRAASAVDGMASVHGDLLSWNMVRDSRTTAECLSAGKHNFRAARPPVLSDGTVAYPGAAHSRCRCYPGPPRRGAPVLPSS